MTVILEIKDGSPDWWLSPDIWTVPNDPEGAKGLPVVGKPCYLWARVYNNGDEKAEDATVRFYWANPATGFNRMSANLVGSAAVTVDAGQVAEVLCLTPWVPTFVNQGHECILAEAFQTSRDPLPSTPDFNVPTDRHVAQRNISVLETDIGQFHFAFELHNPARVARTFSVIAKEGKLAELEPLIPLLSENFHLPREEGCIHRLSFVQSACPNKQDFDKATPAIREVKLGPNERTGYSLVGILEQGAKLVHVVQEVEGQVVGGLSVLIMHARGK